MLRLGLLLNLLRDSFVLDALYLVIIILQIGILEEDHIVILVLLNAVPAESVSTLIASSFDLEVFVTWRLAV